MFCFCSCAAWVRACGGRGRRVGRAELCQPQEAAGRWCAQLCADKPTAHTARAANRCTAGLPQLDRCTNGKTSLLHSLLLAGDSDATVRDPLQGPSASLSTFEFVAAYRPQHWWQHLEVLPKGLQSCPITIQTAPFVAGHILQHRCQDLPMRSRST